MKLNVSTLFFLLLFWGTLCGTWYLTMGTEVKHLRVATQNSACQMGTTELITSGWIQDSIYFGGCKTCELLYCITYTADMADPPSAGSGSFFLFGWKTTWNHNTTFAIKQENAKISNLTSSHFHRENNGKYIHFNFYCLVGIPSIS